MKLPLQSTPMSDYTEVPTFSVRASTASCPGRQRNSAAPPQVNRSLYCPSSSWAMVPAANSLGRFHPEPIPKRIRVLQQLFSRPSSQTSVPDTVMDSVGRSIKQHMISDEGNSDVSRSGYRRPSTAASIDSSVTNSVRRHYRAAVSRSYCQPREEKARPQTQKEESVPFGRQGLNRPATAKRKDLREGGEGGKKRKSLLTAGRITDANVHEAFRSLRKMKFVSDIISQTRGEEKAAAKENRLVVCKPEITESPESSYCCRPRTNLKNNVVMKRIGELGGTHRSRQGKKSRSISGSFSGMLDEGCERKELERIRDLRRRRITNIYECVLYKAGKDSARKLYNDYFGGESDKSLADVRHMERRAEEKEAAGKKESRRYQQNMGRRCPTASEKRRRISSYGRWYLPPKDFSAALRPQSESMLVVL